MSAPIVIFDPESLDVTLVTGVRVEQRPASLPIDPESADSVVSASAVRSAINASAEWLASQSEARRSPVVFCVDVSRSVCTMVRAQSQQTQVVNAAFREAWQDWGEGAGGASVEPLVRTEPGASRGRPTKAKKDDTIPPPTRGAFPVLAVPDAEVRLLLDATDRRGVRAQGVVSLWHALAARAAGDAGNEAVIVIDGDRLIWAWSDAGDLVTGGSIELHGRTPDAASVQAIRDRLSMDWLTWSAQTGADTASVVLIAPEAWSEQLAPALERAWDPARVRAIASEQPLVEALRRPTIPGDTSNPRRSLRRASARPNRATRRSLLWIGAAMVAFAGVLGVTGYRLSEAGTEVASQRDAFRDRTRTEVESLGDPTLLSRPNLVGALRSEFARLQMESRDLELPEPRPVYEQVARTLEIIESYADRGVRLQTMTIEAGGTRARDSRLQVFVPDADRRLITEITIKLNEEPGAIAWQQRRGSQLGDRIDLTGTWK